MKTIATSSSSALGDVLLVPYGAAGLDDHRDTGFCCSLDAVGERIERVARARAAFRTTGRLLRRDLSRLDAILLPGADSPCHAVADDNRLVGAKNPIT